MKMQDFMYINSTIAEMSDVPDGFKIDVPIAQGVDIKKLTKGDKDPLFVTVEALNSQVSKNGRFYSDKVIKQIEKQINTDRPDAYLGHLKADELSTKHPEAQTIWVGATIKNVGGKNRLFVKGYVLPYAKKLKSYLRAAKAAGKQIAVSIFGKGKEIFNKTLNAFEVSEFQLESLDWARPGSAGIATLGLFNLTAEMSDNTSNKKVDFWKKLSVKQIEKNRPDLILEMVEETRKDIEELVKDQVKSKLIKEMTKEIDELKKENATYLIKEMVGKEVNFVPARNKIIENIVSEMTEYEKDEVRKLTSDMLQSKETRKIIREMISNNSKRIAPVVDNRNQGTDIRKFTVKS